jgi:hypothetical protein
MPLSAAPTKNKGMKPKICTSGWYHSHYDGAMQDIQIYALFSLLLFASLAGCRKSPLFAYFATDDSIEKTNRGGRSYSTTSIGPKM